LPLELWRDIGWSGAELIGDMAHAYCYCQRTADGRIAVGGRGLPYLLNSKIQRDGRPTAGTISELRGILARLFPAVAHVPLAHAWQGVLGFHAIGAPLLAWILRPRLVGRADMWGSV